MTTTSPKRGWTVWSLSEASMCLAKGGRAKEGKRKKDSGEAYIHQSGSLDPAEAPLLQN